MALVPPSSHTSLPPGWTDDGSGNLTSSGTLTFTLGTSSAILGATNVLVQDSDSGETYGLIIGAGVVSEGADATLSIVKGLAVTDPGNAGEYYSVAGIIHASAG